MLYPGDFSGRGDSRSYTTWHLTGFAFANTLLNLPQASLRQCPSCNHAVFTRTDSLRRAIVSSTVVLFCSTALYARARTAQISGCLQAACPPHQVLRGHNVTLSHVGAACCSSSCCAAHTNCPLTSYLLWLQHLAVPRYGPGAVILPLCCGAGFHHHHHTAALSIPQLRQGVPASPTAAPADNGFAQTAPAVHTGAFTLRRFTPSAPNPHPHKFHQYGR